MAVVLIVIRGASGSGKSTLAAQLQRRLGWPTAVLGQDHFRRSVYGERHDAGHADGMEHAALLEVAATHCLAAGHDVVLEGIFQADRYSEMLERLARAADDARFYAFDLSFEETVRRHEGRPEASEVSPVQMREWYLGWDRLPFVAERSILQGEESSAVVQRVLDDRGRIGYRTAASPVVSGRLEDAAGERRRRRGPEPSDEGKREERPRCGR